MQRKGDISKAIQQNWQIFGKSERLRWVCRAVWAIERPRWRDRNHDAMFRAAGSTASRGLNTVEGLTRSSRLRENRLRRHLYKLEIVIVTATKGSGGARNYNKSANTQKL